MDLQGRPMIRTATEQYYITGVRLNPIMGVRVQSVEDVIDPDWLREEYKRRVPLWRRVWLAIKGETL